MAEPFRGSVRPQTARWPAAKSPPQPEVSSIRDLPEISSPNISPFPDSSIASPLAEIGDGKVIDVRRKVARNQKAVKWARIQRRSKTLGIRKTKNWERSNAWKGVRVRGYCNPVLSNWAMLPRTRSVALSKSDQFRGGSWSLLAIRLKAMRFAAVHIAWRSAGTNPFSRLAISSTEIGRASYRERG